MRAGLVATVTGALAASVAAFGLLGGPAGAGPGIPVIPVTITKTVVGTDPGVAFPITLRCWSEGPEPNDIQIPNNGEISETVNLRNGQSTVIQVTLPPQPPDLAACSVTEDLAAAGVPSNYTCSVAVAPESAVLYDGEAWPASVSFAVTNTCSVAAAEAIRAQANRFTG